MSDSLRDKRMRSETQISELLDERLNNKKVFIIYINYYLITILLHKRVAMKVYAKNSFDRLGDDLTELILQYLTFEDKVRLECVSKQWKNAMVLCIS